MLKEYKVKSRNGKEKYTVYVDESKNYSSCTCVYSSLWGVNKKKPCRHIIEILKCLELKKKIERSA